MSTEDLNMSVDAEMEECEGDKVVTMMDVLQEQQEFEDDANAVLGGSDDKNCTYPKGYIKRQALYACITCCPDAKDIESNRAGVCLACSLMCHENHELVELYTKRNFRCDCGNPKFNSHPCQFTPDKPELNDGNTYNQNFSGLYCICHRPYPDPDATFEDDMIQCIICEDWLHASHLDAAVPGNDQYAEMICKACMEKNEFLHDYTVFAINSESGDVDVINDSNIEISLCNGDGQQLVNGINEEVSESISEIAVVTYGSEKECETKDLIHETEKDENEAKVTEKTKCDESSKVDANETNEITEKDTTQMNGDTEPKHNESETKESLDTEETTKIELESDNNKLTEKDNSDENTTANSCEKNLDSKEDSNVSDKTENPEADSTKMELEPNDISTIDTQSESNDVKSAETTSEIASDEKNEPVNENPESTSEVTENNDEVGTTASESTEQESINETKEKLETTENPETSNEKSVVNDPVMDAIDELLNSDEKEKNSTETTQPDSSSNTTVMETEASIADAENNTTVMETDASIANAENKDIEINDKDIEINDSTKNAALTSDNKDENAPTSPNNECKDTETENQELDDNSTKENEALIDNVESTVDSSSMEVSEKSEIPLIDSTNTGLSNETPKVDGTSPENESLITNGHQGNESRDESNDTTETTNQNKRKLSTEQMTEDTSPKKAKIEENCKRPKHGKKTHKGATFWPTNFRSKLCTCGQCITMYKDLNVLFLTDLEDAVSYYENLGKSNVESGISQYEKGMQALSSLDRIQQINALTEYNNMRDKLLDFLKSFKDRKEIVKEEDIKAFFAGMKPRREPDGVYFCR